MDEASLRLEQPVDPSSLNRTAVLGAQQHHWMPFAIRMSVRTAIQNLLLAVPQMPDVEVVELVDPDQAQRIHRTNAARAVLIATLSSPPGT